MKHNLGVITIGIWCISFQFFFFPRPTVCMCFICFYHRYHCYSCYWNQTGTESFSHSLFPVRQTLKEDTKNCNDSQTICFIRLLADSSVLINVYFSYFSLLYFILRNSKRCCAFCNTNNSEQRVVSRVGAMRAVTLFLTFLWAQDLRSSWREVLICSVHKSLALFVITMTV